MRVLTHRSGARLRVLRDHLIDAVLGGIDDVVLNGSRQLRLPGNAHFTFRGCEGDSLLMLLDANGIECSTGSACTAGVAQPSHVLLAMGADADAARADLTERGIEVTPVDDQPWGRFVYFSDPDGNRWSLQQLPNWS